jgi:2-methylcitrate dehydratase PrpD
MLLAQPFLHYTQAKLDRNFDQRGRIKGGIGTKDGRSLESHILLPLGDASRPMSRESLIEKFRDCCEYSVTTLSSSAVQNLIDLIDHLEVADPTDFG